MLCGGGTTGRVFLNGNPSGRELSCRGRRVQCIRVVAERLFGLLLEERDEVVSVLGLLETAEGHLGAGNVLLGVLEVVELSKGLATCQMLLGSAWVYIPASSRPR